MTGGAFGSLIAQWMKLTDAERTTLLVAGASAGMSATFAAPLAATLLAVELLLFECDHAAWSPSRWPAQSLRCFGFTGWGRDRCSLRPQDRRRKTAQPC